MMKRIVHGVLAILVASCAADVALAAAPGRVTRFEVTPTSLVARGEPPLQNIDLAIDVPAALDACTLKVWADDRLLTEKLLGGLQPGANQRSILLPEPAATQPSRWALYAGDALLAEAAVTWKPPRHWTIYEVFSSHVDIGLHDPQYKQRRMGDLFLDQLPELIDQTATRPEASRFRYVVEGLWWWGNYERDRSERAARQLIERYAKPGLIGIGASHSGNRTEVYSTEELCRSAYYARELRYRWGLAADTMLMVDNNGITWPLVTAYADAGIKYLGFYPNPWNPDAVKCWSPGGTPGSRIDVGWESPLPHLFYWQGPDGRRRILVWTSLSYGNLSSFSFGHNKADPAAIAPIMARQLALAEARYPYDVWMVPNYNDNMPPGLNAANRAQAWNAVWRWPELRTVGDLSVPFRDVERRFGDRIPTLRGLMTAGWAQHPVATPSLLADKMAADRSLATAEKLSAVARAVDADYLYPINELRRAWDALVCNDEHGYGTSYYKGRPVYDTWLQKRDWIAQATRTADAQSTRALRAIAARVATTLPAVLVFNPTLQARSETVEIELPASCAGLVSIAPSGGKPLATVKSGNKLQFRVTGVPPLGYRTLTLARGTAEGPSSRPAATPPVLENAHYRIAFDGSGAISRIFDKQLQRDLLDPQAPYRGNQLVYSQDRNQSFVSPSAAQFTLETSPLAQTVIARIDDPHTQAEIVQRVTLPVDEKRIDIDNRLSHVRDFAGVKRWDRFGYYAFPFDVPGGELRIGLNGCHARAYADQTGLTTDTYHAARDWVHVGNGRFGIVLTQQDSQLIECGKIHTPKRTFGETPANMHLYSYAFNDWLYAHAYETGPSHINLRFRYAITSHAGPFDDAQTPRFAQRAVTPLRSVVIAQAQPGSLPAVKHSFLHVAAESVELLTLKLSEAPGRGLIARFHETAGKPLDAAPLEIGWGQPCRLTRCSLLERDAGSLETPAVSLEPFGYCTLRIEPQGSAAGALAAAPAVDVAQVTDRTVALQWAPVAGAKQYYIYRGDEPGFAADEYHLLAATRDVHYRDAGLSPENDYYYRVAAVDAGVRGGAASAAVKAVTAAGGASPPAQVGSFYSGLISSPRAWRGDTPDILYVQWGQNRESDLAHYELYRGERPDFVVGPESFVAQVEPGPYVTVPYEDKGLKPHAAYYYRVVAVDRAGHKSVPSDVCCGITRELVAAPAQ